MNLYFCVAGVDTINLDVMVVAGSVEQAIDVWRLWASRVLDAEQLEGASSEPYLVDLHIQRPTTGYIEWGTFKFHPVEVP